MFRGSMPSDVITNVKTIVYHCPPRLKAESCHLMVALYALFPANEVSLYEVSRHGQCKESP